MNSGRWQRTWFWFQRNVGAGWIDLLAGPLFEVHGFEHVAATPRDRPLLVAANHRTAFDLYAVMCVLFRRLPGWRSILFPVRGRYFYQTLGGITLNWLAAWWSMYPPFFHSPGRRRFDQWALNELARLCRDGPGRIVGFHPEGTRGKGPDPYALLPAQAGIGRLLHDARPITVPVFVIGLSNSLRDILAKRRRGGESIRLRFGPPIDYTPFLDLPPTTSTYRQMAELVMDRIAQLAEEDRNATAGAASGNGAQ
jgi:1-acyl-sn-glycerol-3-phosphate acyltransferase